MISNKFRYVLIIIFAALIIVEIVIMDYDNFWNWGNWLGILAPVLMILAMVMSIKHVNKHGEN
ncbi:hypothetical protein [Seonamhaeicola maritimus]|uniref:Uncharacterized protein n=1 Tax=Seonamhaeicola maritimus TaxID=2591822 RepID=A0A5C7GN04_9FLAO|nr:hypothetical protein [Seonamhaeicola maritimus]TXG39695.1 hypothetical protein FUA22_07465 [Seonamhaeicola maritimus]